MRVSTTSIAVENMIVGAEFKLKQSYETLDYSPPRRIIK
jgi:hypothetical protein